MSSTRKRDFESTAYESRFSAPARREENRSSVRVDKERPAFNATMVKALANLPERIAGLLTGDVAEQGALVERTYAPLGLYARSGTRVRQASQYGVLDLGDVGPFAAQPPLGFVRRRRLLSRDAKLSPTNSVGANRRQVPNLHKVFLSSGWYDAGQLDGRLSQAIRFDEGLAVHFGQETKLTIAACVRLLAYVDAFSSRGLPVELHDLTNWGLGGYLDRAGVFEQLGTQVTLVGLAPSGSAQSRRGQNDGLEEIVRIPATGEMDRSVPQRLAQKLASCAAPEVKDALGGAAFTYFAELIGNVRTHSGSPTPGYAALQVYTPRAGSRRLVEVVVCDAGTGILGTLRPALIGKRLPLGQLNDQALLLHAVNSGVSRHGQEAGCGITQSAKRLLRLPEPRLELRLPETRIRFEPGPSGGYVVTQARTGDAVAGLPGTHWIARYALD